MVATGGSEIIEDMVDATLGNSTTERVNTDDEMKDVKSLQRRCGRRHIGISFECKISNPRHLLLDID